MTHHAARLLSLLLIARLLVGATTASAADPALRIEGALVTIIEETEIPAREAGVLSVVAAREGQTVAADELLAGVEDAEAKLELERARAEADIARTKADNDVNVRYAKKGAELAEAELRRARESIARFERSISQTELDKLKLEAERCTLAVEEAEHELQIARQTLHLKQTEVATAKQAVERRRIVSPLNGVVVQVHRRHGEWVKPGDTVLRVMRIDRLRIEAFVPAGRVPALRVGAPVQFEAQLEGAPPRTYDGKLVFISPEVDAVNGQIRLWAEIDNRDQSLRPGIRGTLVGTPKSG
jgi:RND family efflux transporter MFP subunit